MEFSLARRLTAEFVATALLLAVVVGSGIMGERLAGGNVALVLLGNSLATGAGLAVLIVVFGPVSGCHMNPAVSLALALRGDMGKGDAALYVVVQIAGAAAGVIAAHVMFDLAPIAAGTKIRSGTGQWLGEAIATFGLVLAILGCARFRPAATPWVVGLFITAGYWFTSSTSFANPAVTLARALTDTFTGIRPLDAPLFIAAEIAGALVATALAGLLFGTSARQQPRREP